jgi:hypothetical protein
MRLTSRTIQLLKNFSLINPSIVIKPGNKLASLSSLKEVMAKATIAETFERQVAIFEIPKFLGTLSLFKDPDIDFQEKYMRIRQDKEHVDYFYADPSLIVTPGDKKLPIGDVVAEFELPQQTLASVLKALHVLQLPSIVIEGDGETVTMCATDIGHPTSNKYEVEVGKSEHTFQSVIKGERIKVLPEDFKVTVNTNHVAYFQGDSVEYWVAGDPPKKK